MEAAASGGGLDHSEGLTISRTDVAIPIARTAIQTYVNSDELPENAFSTQMIPLSRSHARCGN
jgi:hypothetical protein